jgi:hypothetical protein
VCGNIGDLPLIQHREHPAIGGGGVTLHQDKAKATPPREQLQRLLGPGGVKDGTLQRGDRLDSGYYVYMPSVDDQDQSEREERKAPVMQIAVKLAGAIHTADVIISINR